MTHPPASERRYGRAVRWFRFHEKHFNQCLQCDFAFFEWWDILS